MGTGIVSILLFNFPFQTAALYWASVVIFILNIALFFTFLITTILRYTLYPYILHLMIRHPAQSLMVSTFPLGLATIISMLIFVCVPVWGGPMLIFAWGLWWADSAMSLALCVSMPMLIMQVHKPELRNMTAVWLLPVATPIVSSATGGVVAGALADANMGQFAMWTLVTCYISWGMGFSLSMSVLVIYFLRLLIHRIPPRDVMVSVFLPLGPLGSGGYGILLFGKVARRIFQETGSLNAEVTRAGDILYVVGWVVALVMWGYGSLWLCFALASICRRRFPFNMGWWAFTFPLGVLATSAILLGKEMPSLFFSIIGAVSGFSRQTLRSLSSKGYSPS